MPTYQYRCRECGEDLEVVQSFTDNPLTTCPNCKKKALRKVFAAPGIAFKGSGFYKTDSRSGNGKSGGSKPSSTPPGETKAEKSDKAETKADTSSSKAASSTKKSDSTSKSATT